eukprot:5566349-Lingulodinium_polyedra.AAC.1
MSSVPGCPGGSSAWKDPSEEATAERQRVGAPRAATGAGYWKTPGRALEVCVTLLRATQPPPPTGWSSFSNDAWETPGDEPAGPT